MKSAIAWFAENHVAANLLMAFIILAGVVTGLTMKIEVFPESSLDKISITTSYPGASPAEIEEAVVRRIEEQVAGYAGVKQIDSVAREGYGSVIVEVIKGYDLQTLLDEIKSAIDALSTLPENAEKPIVREVTRRAQVLSVAVFGDASEATIKHLAEQIEQDLTNLPDITLTEFFGLRNREIYVEVSENDLRRFGLTLGELSSKIRQTSLDLPAGRVKTAGGEILIRTKGKMYLAEDYRDVAVITRPNGTTVTLDQIAHLVDGFVDVDYLTRFQTKKAVAIQVYRVADQNALRVAAQVKEYIEKIRPTLPEGVDIDYFQDMSKVLKSRIWLLLKNMGFGLVLVSLLLGMFMNLRLSFWVTLGIPISFLFGLMILPQVDVSINMISLFAFIMVLGIVVDDAIVIGENIFQKQEQGFPPLKAAVSGALEVGVPVIFSVLTTMVAFWPLLLGSGMMGKVLRNLPVVVILVLLGSLVESLLILPAHLAGGHTRAISKKRSQPKEKITVRWLKSFINGPYTRLVNFCVHWRYAVMAGGVAVLLLAVGTFTSGWLKFSFFPKVESDVMQCTITMPVGTPMDQTVNIVKIIEKKAKETLEEYDRKRPEGAEPLFQQIMSIVGFHVGGRGASGDQGGHLAHIFVQLADAEKRDISSAVLVKAWRDKVGKIPGVESLGFQAELFSAGNPVEVHLSMDDNEKLLQAAEDLKKELRSYSGVFDVADSFLPGKKEMQLKLKPAARSLGLTLNDLATQVRNAFYGAEALRLLRDKEEVKVMVRYPDSERRSLNSVEEMRIRTPGGQTVPFREVAEVHMEQGYASIERVQRRRVVKVSADVDETITNAHEVRTRIEKEFLGKLVNNYPGLRYSIEGEGKQQKESMQDVIRGFIVALFLIYCLLAVPFKSFFQPIVVMAAIPFGIAGAIIGHILMGYNLSILSIFGIVGLAGVVVNDSLVLIHAANRLRAEGLDPHRAVTSAGALRFRAILLTSLTTFAGLAPMILERSIQAKFLIPMAISLGFGVLFATGITLILVPCGYMILEDVSLLLSRIHDRIFHGGSLDTTDPPPL